MKTIVKTLSAVVALSCMLSAGSINLVGVGAGVSVLGLEVGVGAGVNVGYHSPVISNASSCASKAVKSVQRSSKSCDSKSCDAVVYKPKCYSQSFGAPLTFLEDSQNGDRVVEVTEYYCLGCPVCLSCK